MGCDRPPIWSIQEEEADPQAAIRSRGPRSWLYPNPPQVEPSSSCETFSPPACSSRRARPKGVNSNIPRMRSSNPRYRIHPRLEHLPTGPKSSARGMGASCLMSLISSSRGRRSFPDVFVPTASLAKYDPRAALSDAEDRELFILHLDSSHALRRDPPKCLADLDQRPPRIARLQSVTDQSDQIGTDRWI